MGPREKEFRAMMTIDWKPCPVFDDENSALKNKKKSKCHIKEK